MSWEATLAIMILASVAVATYVSWPLLVGIPRVEPHHEASDEESALDHLMVQRDATYSAIKELEFDHAMGNLSAQDYGELVRRYEDRAIAILKTIDEVSQEERANGVPATAAPAISKRGVSSEDAIERAVAALRQERRRGNGRGGSYEDQIEREVASLRATRSTQSTCPACATPLKSASAAYCSRCGAPLRPKCQACGGSVDREDVFCSACGNSLQGRDAIQVEGTTGGGANA